MAVFLKLNIAIHVKNIKDDLKIMLDLNLTLAWLKILLFPVFHIMTW